jgi:hypothetical protein
VTLAVQALAPITYTPAYLTEKIRHATATLAGERKQVTVLFADLKARWSCLPTRREAHPTHPERLMAACIIMRGGERGHGRWHYGLFGAPVAHEDPPRACCAALGMPEVIRRGGERRCVARGDRGADPLG